MAPLLTLALLVSSSSRWVFQLELCSAALNLVAGMLLVLVLDFADPVLRGVGLGFMILVAFFSFTVWRIPVKAH